MLKVKNFPKITWDELGKKLKFKIGETQGK